MKTSDKATKIFLVALTLLAFLLRVYRLQSQSYWIDEGWTLHYAAMTPAELWHTLQTSKIVPPLYFYSVLIWSRLMGNGEYALRFVSAVFGVMTIPLVYRLGKSFGDRRVGLVAATLVALAPYQVWHSQDARNYAMLTAASVLSMWGFVELWKSARPGNPVSLWFGRRFPLEWCLIYALGTEWALMTHYHAVILVGIQGLFALLTWRRHWRDFLAWGSLLLVVLLVFGVWLIFGLSLLESYQNWIPQPTLAESYVRSAVAYSVGELVPRPQSLLLATIFVAMAVLGFVYAGRRSWGHFGGRHIVALLLAYVLAPNLAAWIYGQMRTPVYLERYLIPVQIGFLLAVAMGVLAVFDWLCLATSRSAAFLRFAARLTSIIPVVALLGTSLWVLRHHYTDPAYAKPDWRGVAHTIQDFEMPGDVVVLTGDGGKRVFEYYYQGKLPIRTDFDTPVPEMEEAQEILADIATKHKRIWFSAYGLPVDAIIQEWLGRNAYPAWHRWIGRKQLALYAGAVDYPETVLNLGRDGMRLVGIRKPDQAVAAGDVLPLAFSWQTDQPLDRDLEVSLRLTNKRGDIFAQSDYPPVSGPEGTSAWPVGQPVSDHRGFWLPAETPPGDYTLQCAIYDREAGTPLGNPFPVASVQVAPAVINPRLGALALPNATHLRVGPLTLVGHILPGGVRPGENVWMWLFWQAPDAGGKSLDPSSRIRIDLSAEGTSVSASVAIGESVGPLDDWRPGQVRRAVYYVGTSPSLTATHAQVRVSYLEAGETTATEGEAVALESIELKQRPRQFVAPPIPQPMDSSLGEPALVKLIGYAMPAGPGTPGGPLPVTLYWKAVVEMEANYTVFVQLLNNDWQVVAQQDSQPLLGAAPTSTWLAGEILTDPYQLLLPADLPAGDYRLIVGLYQAESGARLTASDGNDYVQIATVTVP